MHSNLFFFSVNKFFVPNKFCGELFNNKSTFSLIDFWILVHYIIPSFLKNLILEPINTFYLRLHSLEETSSLETK